MKKLTTIILSAICLVCLSFGLTACGHEHVLEKTSEAKATCTTAGNTEYYSCECGKYFSDAEGENEIQANAWVVPATGHTLSKVSAVASTCAQTGNSEYYACDCGKYFSDEEGLNEIAENSWALPSVAHDYDEEITIEVALGKAYAVRTCKCAHVLKTEMTGVVIANDTASAQQALDNATDNDVIVLADGNYDVLYLRKTADSQPVQSNWAGGGHTFQRTINGLTILSTEGAKLKQIVAETAQYTPAGNQHSNSATEPYLTLKLILNNFTLVNANFELEGATTAINILNNYSMVDGLNLIGCSFVDKDASSTIDSGNRALCADGQEAEDCVKNVVIEGCYFKDLHQAVKINCLENIKISNSVFSGIKGQAIIFTGTQHNVGGRIEISNNKIETSMGERFIRANHIASGAEITVTGNIVTDGITMGVDPDVVKITTIPNDATVIVDDTNSWNGKAVTIG